MQPKRQLRKHRGGSGQDTWRGDRNGWKLHQLRAISFLALSQKQTKLNEDKVRVVVSKRDDALYVHSLLRLETIS